MHVVDFIYNLHWDDVPEHVDAATREALLDLMGVAVSGTVTQLGKIVANHAVDQFGCSDPSMSARILLDGRRCSIAGAALAGSMLIDSVGAHDGYKLTKGHVGCGVLPATLAFSEAEGEVTEKELLTRLLIGDEIGSRAGIALHATARDYHSSGAWVALAAAAIGARSLKLDKDQTREALGIAEYHGPRSQMMRCIDHPTMLKDGSGWGAMAGCSAALLARDGFTGSPAVTIEGEDVKPIWSDLGSRWTITEQYKKAYPVCRWAQPAIAGVLKVKNKHPFKPEQVKRVEVGTFHESKRLSISAPLTTEQAQYSLPFPIAVAMVHNHVDVEHIGGAGLQNSEALRISNLVEIVEVEEYNQCFPELRKSHVVVELADGSVFESGTVQAAGDPEAPFTSVEIEQKFMRLAGKSLGVLRATALKESLFGMDEGDTLQALNAFIYQPVGG